MHTSFPKGTLLCINTPSVRGVVLCMRKLQIRKACRAVKLICMYVCMYSAIPA